MRDIKILFVLVFFTLLTYYGIEPYAHSIMHKHTEPAEYSFGDLDKDASAALGLSGNVQEGRDSYINNCSACHSMSSDTQDSADGILPPMTHGELVAANGVYPPDLSTSADLYDKKYLVGFIKNPSAAAFDNLYKKHKAIELEEAKADSDASTHAALEESSKKSIAGFVAKQKISMPAFDWMSDQEIANIIAYLDSVKKVTDPREAAGQACGRCHSINYGGITANTPRDQLISYLGSFPPDLSQMIKSKGEDYLHKFINDPQKELLGTAMPRVGLNKEAEAKVIKYLETVGDSKKDERNGLGLAVIGFFAILTLFAFMWRKNEMDEVH
jgi:ubiquinol-cytochrome c reductase cytochrome c1 subunit